MDAAMGTPWVGSEDAPEGSEGKSGRGEGAIAFAAEFTILTVA
jgi:hypothetical protein